jgi:uncharacterized protein (TIGR02284 family)
MANEPADPAPTGAALLNRILHAKGIHAMAESIKNDEVIRVLKEVVNALQDSQKGLADIGEHLKDDTLKRYFLAESLKRASFHGELEAELHRVGVHDIDAPGTATGTLHRIWGDLKAKLTHSDHALLVTAEQGEDHVKKTYADALAQPLPLPIQQLLTTEQTHIQMSHDFVRAHRDALAKAA